MSKIAFERILEKAISRQLSRTSEHIPTNIRDTTGILWSSRGPLINASRKDQGKQVFSNISDINGGQYEYKLRSFAAHT